MFEAALVSSSDTREREPAYFTSSAIAPTVNSIGTFGSILLTIKISDGPIYARERLPVSVVEVDVVNSESLQGLCTLFLHIFGFTTDAIGSVSEFGGEENLVSLPGTFEPGHCRYR